MTSKEANQLSIMIIEEINDYNRKVSYSPAQLTQRIDNIIRDFITDDEEEMT